MRNKHLFLSAVLFGLLLVATPSFAATTSEPKDQTTAVSAITLQADAAIPTYEGITVEEPTKAPSAFGSFWRGLKENITLALTFDPNKKAEKAIKFSEERMLIAEKALESSDPNMKEEAQKNLERAQTLIKKARENQERALQKPTEETTRLLKNSAAAAERQQDIFDRIEQKSNDVDTDEILEVRKNITEESRRLETALQNENIPQEVRDHLKDVKARIEEHASQVEQRVEEVKQLREAIKNGDESAKAKLEQFKQDRLQEVQKNQDDRKVEFEKFQSKISDLKTSAEKGDAKAVELLKQIEQMPDFNNRIEEAKRKFMGQQSEQDDDRRGPPPGIKNRPERNEQQEINIPEEAKEQGSRELNEVDKKPSEKQNGQTRPGFFSRFQYFLQRKNEDQSSTNQQSSNNQPNVSDEKEQKQNRVPSKESIEQSQNDQESEQESKRSPEQANVPQNKPGFFSVIKNFVGDKREDRNENKINPEETKDAENAGNESFKQIPPSRMTKPFQRMDGEGAEGSKNGQGGEKFEGGNANGFGAGAPQGGGNFGGGNPGGFGGGPSGGGTPSGGGFGGGSPSGGAR